MTALTPPSEKAAALVDIRRFSPEPRAPELGAPLASSTSIKATPFRHVDTRSILPRRWIYGRHYIREFVSATVASGGTGKSALAVVEALAIATGRPLLGVKPQERVKVWIWNGEDPLNELQRRLAAAMLVFEIPSEEVEGWLFLDSGRNSPIVIATQGRNGTSLNQGDIDSLEATIRLNDIGLVILDPFVSLHRVSENDNGAIDQVTKALAGVADRTGCAIELVHHVRKTNGNDVTVEDSRGAGALLATVRSARALNLMSPQEARGWGIAESQRRLYFRAYDGKANLAPPAETSTWFMLESVDLGNRTEDRPSDHVGVVTVWQPPKAFDDATIDHMRDVHRRIGGSDRQWRESHQSPEWVGYLVAEVVGLDPQNDADRKKIKHLLKTWIRNGILRVVEGPDDARKRKKFVVAGELKVVAPPL